MREREREMHVYIIAILTPHCIRWVLRHVSAIF